MITTFFPPHHFGGDAVAVQHLSRGLAALGHDVTVVYDVDAWRTLSDAPEPPVTPEPDGITVHRLRSSLGRLGPLLNHQLGRPTLHARRIRQIVEDGRFDVVHFHNVSLVGGPGILGVGGPGPLKLYTAHEHWLVCPTHVLWRHGREPCSERQCLRCQLAHRRPPQLWRTLGRLDSALEHVDIFLASSEFSARKHAEFGFPRPMTVLPLGLPDVPAPAASDPPHPRPYFLFAGRLEDIKGADDAIAAALQVPGADLLVAGEGTDQPRLARLAKGRSDVRFLGRVTPEVLGRTMRDCIALLAPSRCYETFGVVLAEAFRAGVPVIARRLGPFPEIVSQADGGLLFDDLPGLVDAMQTLVADDALRARLGAQGRAAWEARWSEDAVLPRYLEIIEEALRRRG